MKQMKSLDELDMSIPPRNKLYGSFQEADLAQVVQGLHQKVALAWQQSGLVSVNTSFGFAMANPTRDVGQCWNRPYELTWFVSGWGADSQRYCANAMRKLRAAARENRDTLDMSVNDRSAFRDSVESQDADGTLRWGD